MIPYLLFRHLAEIASCHDWPVTLPSKRTLCNWRSSGVPASAIRLVFLEMHYFSYGNFSLDSLTDTADFLNLSANNHLHDLLATL